MRFIEHLKRIIIYHARSCVVWFDKKCRHFRGKLSVSPLIGLCLELVALKRLKLKALDFYFFDSENERKITVEKKRFGYFIAPWFVGNEKPILQKTSLKETDIYQLKDVWISGNSNILITNEDIAYLDAQACFSDDKYFQIDGAVFKQSNDTIYVYSNRKKRVISSGIMLSGNFSWNYYHFIYEFLPKFELFENVSEYKEIPLILDAGCSKVPQYMELVRLFNSDNRGLVFIDKCELLLVRQLIYPSFVNRIPPHYKNPEKIAASDCLFAFANLNFIRKRLIGCQGKNYSKRIFLSRAKQKRRTFNEESIFEICKEFDFQKIETEKLSIIDQIQVFSNAEVIIGGSGAAFSNLLFCKEGCKVICLTGYTFQLSIFSTIAEFAKVDLHYIADDTKRYTKRLNIHDNFTIRPELFRRFLITLIN